MLQTMTVLSFVSRVLKNNTKVLLLVQKMIVKNCMSLNAFKEVFKNAKKINNATMLYPV